MTGMTQAENRGRLANIELLRVLAMLMVIALHYLNKGGVAVSYAQDGSLRNHVAWLLDSFCIVAVNVYVLISGYFLVETGFSFRRLLRLIGQVYFYSLTVPLLLWAVGLADFGSFRVNDWLPYFLPFTSEHYWFATSYLWMYLFVPVLGAAVKKLDQKTLRNVILALLAVFSLVKSVCPFRLSTDRYGYDFGWFMCLFLIAAYIRLYGLPSFGGRRRCLTIYFGCSLFGFAVSAASGYLARRTGIEAFSYYSDMAYCYNYLPCLIASVALFLFFLRTRLPEGGPARLFRFLGPLTFGVYLLHENLSLRDLWPRLLGVERYRGSFSFLWHLLFCVAVVFAAGILTEWLRVRLAVLIRKAFSKKR